MPNVQRRTCLLAAIGSLALPSMSRAREGATVVDESWPDAARGGRAIPVRVRWPSAGGSTSPLTVLLFSHGLGGTRDGGAIWGEAWAAAGFVVMHLQHPGSDLPALRAAAKNFADRSGLREAASPAQLLARLADVGFVLDEIGRRQADRQGRWADVRADRIGMSGHSFGAHTTLGMAGQRYAGFAGAREARLASFIAFSPTVPASGDTRQAFAGLDRPLLSVTGSRDDDVLGNGATPERRIAVFAALPPGGKAQLVLQDADHMTFAGQTGRALEIRPRAAITRDLQAQHHALIARISTDWWRASLLDDATARAHLAAPDGLAAGDIWQRN